MIVKLLTEQHLEFLSLTGGCRGSSESTLVKMSNCWKSHVTAHIIFKLRIEGDQPLVLSLAYVQLMLPQPVTTRKEIEPQHQISKNLTF